MEFFTCECMLDKLIEMTRDEIVNYISSCEVFSLSDSGWMISIQQGNNFLFFCIRFLNIIKPFVSERIFCLKRSAIWMILVWNLCNLVALITVVEIV